MRAGSYTFISLLTAFSDLTLLYGCKEQYTPDLKDTNPNYFVVEGLINTDTDSTIFTLSRTFKLNNNPIEVPEKGAIVQVESDAGAGRKGRVSKKPLYWY